jgi:translation initiation factor 2 beta subunit (eIF-2beta)/eIF-5
MAIVDPFYRYVFPAIETKVLYGGHRLEIVNLPQIARSLRRPEEWILHALQYSLNTGGYTKSSRYFLRGEFSQTQLQAALDVFIETYVRCSLCMNPETSLRVRHHLLYCDCRACGAYLPLDDQKEKLVQFIIKKAFSK